MTKRKENLNLVRDFFKKIAKDEIVIGGVIPIDKKFIDSCSKQIKAAKKLSKIKKDSIK